MLIHPRHCSKPPVVDCCCRSHAESEESRAQICGCSLILSTHVWFHEDRRNPSFRGLNFPGLHPRNIQLMTPVSCQALVDVVCQAQLERRNLQILPNGVWLSACKSFYATVGVYKPTILRTAVSASTKDNATSSNDAIRRSYCPTSHMAQQPPSSHIFL